MLEHARRMLEDPDVRSAYEAALAADSTLAAPGDDGHRTRLHWFFDHSSWAEDRYQLYPVFRSSSEPPAHRGL